MNNSGACTYVSMYGKVAHVRRDYNDSHRHKTTLEFPFFAFVSSPLINFDLVGNKPKWSGPGYRMEPGKWERDRVYRTLYPNTYGWYRDDPAEMKKWASELKVRSRVRSLKRSTVRSRVPISGWLANDETNELVPWGNIVS